MLVFGHRGAQDRSKSENTLEAFREAIRQGADGIECDVRLSRDRQLVVVHDANLHRIAGDAHKVTELTARELASIPLRHGGNIPTFDQVIAQIGATHLIDVEVKQREAIELLIARLASDANLRAHTIVSSFFIPVLEEVQRALPDVRIMLLILQWPLPLRRRRLWRRIQSLKPWGVAFPLSALHTRRVTQIQQLNVFVGGWDRRGSQREARKARALGLHIAIVRRVRDARAEPLFNCKK